MTLSSKAVENIVPIAIEDKMNASYLDYAMSVIVGRAIPDIRDGLKPVHRRIIYAMWHDIGCTHTQAFKKCARIIGEVIGKYHPHGELAVYDALVRMAQDFSLRAPLITGQGNFGSIDGDSPAATRYTEAKLAKLSDLLTLDIDKDTVDFEPNYDGSETQPTVLPSRFLNLLINGSSGIAVGMATNIPPHNVGEVADACLAYLRNNEISVEELMEYIQGPDFPTAGIIVGKNSIRQAYETGRGVISLRGKTEVEDIDKYRQAIIITEIPYGVNKAKLVEKIHELCSDKTIEGITEIRDESNKSGIRVVIELKKDAYTDVITNQLYSYTVLQSSFGINMVALDNKTPRVLSLRDIIAAFVEFREQVVIRRTHYSLKKDRARAHILLGLATAVHNIDEIISLVKASESTAEAREKLLSKQWKTLAEIAKYIILIDTEVEKTEGTMENAGEKYIYNGQYYQLSEDQVKAILEMRLNRLTGLETSKIIKELNDLVSNIEYLNSILSSREVLLNVLEEEILSTKEHASPRLTRIEESSGVDDPHGLVPKEDMIVTVTINGYIKRLPLDTYKTQHRGGKGKFGLTMNAEDSIIQIFHANTHAVVLFFSDMGYVYSLKLYRLPLGSVNSKGKSIVNLLNLKSGERITNIMCLPDDMEQDSQELSIVFITKLGRIRRNNISDFISIRSTGKIAIRIDEGDSLMSVITCKAWDHIFLATQLGKAIRFPIAKVRIMKSRTSDGVNAIRLTKDDIIVSSSVLEGDKSTYQVAEDSGEADDEQEDLVQEEMVQTEENIVAKDNENDDTDGDDEIGDHQCILSITSKGYGKKSLAAKYRVTNRGGVGITNININAKTIKRIGTLVTTMAVKNEDEVILITSSGKVLRFKVSDVRNTSRNTSGVIIARLDADEHIVSATPVMSDGESDIDMIGYQS